jgi:hypothetical protein
LRVLSEPSGDSFETTLEIIDINLPSPGTYKLSLRTFIHCANEGCENANDYILIRTNEKNVGFKDILKIGYSECRIRDEKWVLDETYFTVNSLMDFFVGDSSKITRI